jgi:hypothetical protein
VVLACNRRWDALFGVSARLRGRASDVDEQDRSDLEEVALGLRMLYHSSAIHEAGAFIYTKSVTLAVDDFISVCLFIKIKNVKMLCE